MPSITVTVVLLAHLRRYLPPGADGLQRYVVPAGARVGDLLDVIGIRRDQDITIGVDGELADRETPLREGADVVLLGPMEGGARPVTPREARLRPRPDRPWRGRPDLPARAVPPRRRRGPPTSGSG